MRVTSNTFPDEFLTQVQGLQQRQIITQRAISSGQKVQESSDDPSAFRRGSIIQSNQRLTKDFQDQIERVRSRTQANYDAEKQLQTIISRASELATKANGTMDQPQMNVMAEEINNLLEQTVTTGNRQQEGQFLFGGTYLQPTDTDPVTTAAYVPFSVTRNASNKITAVTYRGNEKVQQVNIESSNQIDYNVIGSSVTGTPRGLFINNTTNVFNQLISMRDNLLAGNITAVQNPGITNLRAIEDNTATVLGTTSANLARLQVVGNIHSTQLNSDSNTLSQIVDTDITEAITNLQRTQTAYQAALQVGAKILDLSLLNFVQ